MFQTYSTYLYTPLKRLNRLVTFIYLINNKHVFSSVQKFSIFYGEFTDYDISA